ncbi:AKIP1 protein, partial [Hypocryptadius cinnamomeus]|nr:AKIP1 protein [Hypocryptadius cinnamomeus]
YPHMIFSVSVAVQKCYGSMAASKCKENEIKHFCKYHGKSVERKMDPTEEEVTFFFLFFFFSKPRRPSKDFYIEVSPGIYSVTAISEDMVEQTHVVDVNAGQSVDLTFVL